jgi:thiol-disulfide isomerase/thioredoxin
MQPWDKRRRTASCCVVDTRLLARYFTQCLASPCCQRYNVFMSNKNLFTAFQRRIVVVLFGLFAVLWLGGCGTRDAAPSTVPAVPGGAIIAQESRMLDRSNPRPGVGDPAPDFSYTLPDGSEQRLSDLHGQQVLLNFWASWCGPCLVEMPEIQQVADDRADTLVVLAVNRNETPAVVSRFVQENPYRFSFVVDIAGAIGDHYGATGLPMTFFINSDGTIGSRHVGALSQELLDQHLEALQ